ncbi:MAG: CHASE2 domain-containing protein [Cyanobacteria bacterium J06592_8]
MTEQQVVLKLDGNLEIGVKVTLEIWLENQRELEITGGLPPNPELATYLQHHWKNYRSIGAPYRIITEGIIYDGKINPVDACKDSAQELRDRFWAWLEASEFKRIDRQLRDHFSLNQTVQVLIRTSDSQIQKLPWHLWDWVESRQAEVAFSSLEYSSISSPSINYQVRILAILGHSQGIDVEQDRRTLESLPNVNLVFLVEPQRREINDQLWDKTWDILFFAGHSETQEDEGKIYINPQESLTLSELKYGLKQAVKNGLKLAIFNSCDGLGLAKKLSDLHLPRMIIMREVVPDEVAQSFLKYFLTAFAITGESLTFAVRKARERLHDDLEGNLPCASWLPVIFQHPAARSLTWTKLCETPDLFSPQPKRLSLSQWSYWKKILMMSLMITSLVVGMRSLGMLQIWELKAKDALMRLRPDQPPDPRLLIVTVTEKDIQAQNPDELRGSLSDTTLKQLLEKLNQYQPRVIGLDIYRPFPVQKNKQQLAKFLNDEKLIVVCEIGGGENNPSIPPPNEVSLPQIGFSDVPIDPDGIVRRQFLGMTRSSECNTNKSFSFHIAERYLKAEGIEFKGTSPDPLQIGSVKFKKLQASIGGYDQLDARGYQILLNYRSSQAPARTVTLSEILSDRFDSKLIQDKIVLIGTTAQSIDDGFLTPYSADYSPIKYSPGVFIQAQMISQILSAVQDNQPLLWAFPQWGEILLILGCSVLGDILLTVYFNRQKNIVFYLMISSVNLVFISSIGYVALIQGLWIPIVPLGLVLILLLLTKAAFPKTV